MKWDFNPHNFSNTGLLIKYKAGIQVCASNKEMTRIERDRQILNKPPKISAEPENI
jgi:hypothetical protein